MANHLAELKSDLDTLEQIGGVVAGMTVEQLGAGRMMLHIVIHPEGVTAQPGDDAWPEQGIFDLG